MFTKLKLRLKFTLILGLAFLGGIILSGAILSNTYYQNAQKEVANKTLILLSTINAVKDYTNTNIEPLLENKQKKSPTFIPETLPFFAAREIFESFRQQQKYQDFLYKEAALNPTNLRDQADSFESQLIGRFRQDSNLKQLDGLLTIKGQELLYISRPLAVTQQSCLQCHSTPEAAPKSQIKSYGSKNGMGWKLNEIVAAQTIYVPVQEVFTIYRQQFFLAMVNFMVIFATISLLIDWLLKKTVIQPITPLARLAQEISKDEINSAPTVELNFRKLNKVAKRSDELGQLARTFQLMTEVVRSREQTLKQQLQNLRHEHDSVNKFTNLMTKKGKIVHWQHLLETAKRARNFSHLPSERVEKTRQQDHQEE